MKLTESKIHNLKLEIRLLILNFNYKILREEIKTVILFKMTHFNDIIDH